MRKTTLRAAAMSLLALPLMAGAASARLEPGLWETTAKTEMVGMPFSPPPQTHRSCLTKQQSEHPWRQLQANKNEHCKFTHVKVDERSASWEMECDGQGGHMTGKGETTFADPKHMHGTMHMHMRAHGQDVTMKIETQAHWVGASCPQ